MDFHSNLPSRFGPTVSQAVNFHLARANYAREHLRQRGFGRDLTRGKPSSFATPARGAAAPRGRCPHNCALQVPAALCRLLV